MHTSLNNSDAQRTWNDSVTTFSLLDYLTQLNPFSELTTTGTCINLLFACSSSMPSA